MEIDKMSFLNGTLKATGESIVFCGVYFGLVLQACLMDKDDLNTFSTNQSLYPLIIKSIGYLVVFTLLSAPWVYMWEFMDKSETIWVTLLLNY